MFGCLKHKDDLCGAPLLFAHLCCRMLQGCQLLTCSLVIPYRTTLLTKCSLPLLRLHFSRGSRRPPAKPLNYHQNGPKKQRKNSMRRQKPSRKTLNLSGEWCQVQLTIIFTQRILRQSFFAIQNSDTILNVPQGIAKCKYPSPNKHSENGYPQNLTVGFVSLNSRAVSSEILHVFLYVAAIMAFHLLVFVQSVEDLLSPALQFLQFMAQGDAATFVETY